MWDYSAASRRCWDRMGIGELSWKGKSSWDTQSTMQFLARTPEIINTQYSQPRLSRPRLSRPRLSLIGWGWDDYLPWPRHQKHPSECLIVTRPRFQRFHRESFHRGHGFGIYGGLRWPTAPWSKKTRGFWKKWRVCDFLLDSPDSPNHQAKPPHKLMAHQWCLLVLLSLFG